LLKQTASVSSSSVTLSGISFHALNFVHFQLSFGKAYQRRDSPVHFSWFHRGSIMIPTQGWKSHGPLFPTQIRLFDTINGPDTDRHALFSILAQTFSHVGANRCHPTHHREEKSTNAISCSFPTTPLNFPW
jgi:hypothetical protein